MRGVSLERNQAKVTIRGVPDRPGCAGRIFSVISAANLSVDMIVQNASSTGTTDLSFTLHKDDFALAEKILAPLVPEIGACGHDGDHRGGEIERRRDRDALACRRRFAAFRLSWGGRE